MNHPLTFLWQFIRHPRSTGAVLPSGTSLCNRMVEGIELSGDQAVVELGPGTGPVTRAIREKIECPSQYLGVELDSGFVRRLRERFADLNFIEGGAAEAPTYVADAGIQSVKAILCGLPFASLPAVVQDGVIAAIDTLLQPGSEFRTFQYAHAYALPAAMRYRKRMTEMFGDYERSRVVVDNVPPAYVLTWRR